MIEKKETKRFFGIRPEYLICFVLTVLTLTAYWQVKDNSFLSFDDEDYITENPYVTRGLTPENIRWAFGFIHANKTYWHPLTWLSHMLDCQIYGLDPGMHHQISLIIHILNGILLFYVLRKMTGSLWKSAFVAVLFVVHPINVESVAWLSERKNVLSTLFFMLTLLTYEYYCKGPTLLKYMLVFLLFILGLMAKPMLVTLPFILLLLDYWPLGRFRLGSVNSGGNNTNNIHFDYKLSDSNYKVQGFLFLVFEKVPFLIISLGIVPLITSSVQKIVISTEIVPMSLRISNLLVSYVGYLGKMIWPQKLSFFYPYPDMIPIWQIAGSIVLLFSISTFMILHIRKMPYLLTGWLWYLGTLMPVSGIIQVGLWPAMADRFAYIPFIGIFIIVAWGVPVLLEKLHLGKTGLVVLAVVLLAALMIKTRFQVTRWSDSVTLFKYAIQIDAENKVAHNNFGVVLARKGRMDKAELHYLEALRIDPKYPMAHNNLGAALRVKKNYDKAVQHYLKALTFDPNYEEAYYNLGITFYLQGKFQEAVNSYRSALRINSYNVDTLINLGSVLKKMGKLSESVRCYEKALSLSPQSKTVHEEFKKVLTEYQETEVKLKKIKEELKRKPGDSKLHYKLGRHYQRSGKWGAAAEQYQKALIGRPNDISIRTQLAIVNAIQGKYEKAIYSLRKVIDLNPEHPDAYYYLACIFSKEQRIDDSTYWLKQSIERGFDNWNKIKTDKNLQNIRSSLYYKELMRRLEKEQGI